MYKDKKSVEEAIATVLRIAVKNKISIKTAESFIEDIHSVWRARKICSNCYACACKFCRQEAWDSKNGQCPHCGHSPYKTENYITLDTGVIEELLTSGK